MSALFYFSFYVVEHYHSWSNRQKNCLHLPMENGIFLLEKDGRKYSNFSMMCLNEGSKEKWRKNESSSSFFCKIGLN